MFSYFAKRRLYRKFQKAMWQSKYAGRIRVVPVLLAGDFPSPALAEQVREVFEQETHFAIDTAPPLNIGGMGRPLARAQKLLEETSAAVLIWAEPVPERREMRLGFITRAASQSMDYWPLTEHHVPERLNQAFAEAIKALALSALEPALNQDRDVLQKPLENALTRLDVLLNRPPQEAEGRLPVAEEDRPVLLHAYAQGALALAHLLEDEEILPRAIRAAGGAAAGYDVLRNPRAAGDARMLVGLALHRMGTRGKDPAWLKQAAEAYLVAQESGIERRGADAVARTRLKLAETLLELIKLDKADASAYRRALKEIDAALIQCRIRRDETGKDSAWLRAADSLLMRLKHWRQKDKKATGRKKKSKATA